MCVFLSRDTCDWHVWVFGPQRLSAQLALAAHDELCDGKQASPAPDSVQVDRLAVTAALMGLMSGTLISCTCLSQQGDKPGRRTPELDETRHTFKKKDI